MSTRRRPVPVSAKQNVDSDADLSFELDGFGRAVAGSETKSAPNSRSQTPLQDGMDDEEAGLLSETSVRLHVLLNMTGGFLILKASACIMRSCPAKFVSLSKHPSVTLETTLMGALRLLTRLNRFIV